MGYLPEIGCAPKDGQECNVLAAEKKRRNHDCPPCSRMFRIHVGPVFLFVVSVRPQEKKLERLRVGGGSASATQMSLWLAKEGNYYEKHGLNVEVISIPGSSLAIQAMLSGELPIIQAGGAGPIQANL